MTSDELINGTVIREGKNYWELVQFSFCSSSFFENGIENKK